MFRPVKRHVASLCLMLDTLHKYQVTLNLKKCIFYVPFGILLGHMVYKQGLMVVPAKIKVIVNLEAPRNVNEIHAILGHIGYYRKFIKAYAQITAPMEKLLGRTMSAQPRCIERKYGQCVDLGIPRLEEGISRLEVSSVEATLAVPMAPRSPTPKQTIAKEKQLATKEKEKNLVPVHESPRKHSATQK
eukprot:PITA_25990